MTIRSSRLALVSAAAVAVALVVPGTAQAAVATPAQEAAADWLAAQVPSDTHLFETSYEYQGEVSSYVDYGLNLDLQHALRQLGDSTTADQVYAAAVAGADEYTDSFGTRYAGAVGKLATYVQLNGDDATEVGERDLLADLKALQVTEGAEAGRFKDTPDGDYQSANTVGQSWGVRALGLADDAAATSAATFLAAQQCSDGGFRLYQTATGCASTVDATAFAAIALDEVGGHDEDVADAVNYLLEQQADDGSFSDAGNKNSNSTALAARVLAAHDWSGAAGSAAAWIADTQVASGPEAGAIASTRADLAAAGTADIPVLKQDAFVRASVQAALALDLVLPAKAFEVTAPTGYLSAGRVVPVTVRGAAPGEKVEVALSGGSTIVAAANAQGVVSARPTSKSQGIRSLWVTGAGDDRSAATQKVKVLGARTLKVKVGYAARKVGQNQVVEISGLSAGERVRVSYGGKSIKDAKATSKGTFRTWFKVGSSKGTKTVAVLGAYGDRKGSTKFTVR